MKRPNTSNQTVKWVRDFKCPVCKNRHKVTGFRIELDYLQEQRIKQCQKS